MGARYSPFRRAPSLGGHSRPLFLGTYLAKRLNKARKALADNPTPDNAHELARLAWRFSKLLLLEMGREKGL